MQTVGVLLQRQHPQVVHQLDAEPLPAEPDHCATARTLQLTVLRQSALQLHPRRLLRLNQSDAGSAGIFSRRTDRTQDVRVYSHDGPIGHRKRGDNLMPKTQSLTRTLLACRLVDGRKYIRDI
eukprot:1810341-Pyramimonas_sp.AAC.1